MTHSNQKPLYSCWHEECHEERKFHADMLKTGPDGVVCEYCWEEDCAEHSDDEGNCPDWTDLPKFEPREVTCVNAMQGIDDPEAFMRDVR